MLNRLVNDVRFRLMITTTGPVLVRSGQATVLGAKMAPVMTYREGMPEVYLPGSSLKGVFRSHLEKIICSLEPKVVCDPFWERDAVHKKVTNLDVRERDFLPSCSEKFTGKKALKKRQAEKSSSPDGDQNPLRAPEVYRESCPTCRLFGSTAFIGRIAISDAYLLDPSKVSIERRDGVGIDRVTGGTVNQAKFDSDVVSRDVEFITTIHIRNFEIWQLGMLFQVVADMQDELVRVGSGRSRGLGSVVAHIDEQKRDGQPGGVTINTIGGGREKPEELWGLGRWLAEKGDSNYRTWTDDMLVLSEPVVHQQEGIWASRVFSGDGLDKLRTAAITDFLSRIQQWKERPGSTEVPAQESRIP